MFSFSFTLVFAFIILVVVITVHMFTSRKERFGSDMLMDAIDRPYNDLKPFASAEDWIYLKKRVKPLNTNYIQDVAFLKKYPNFVKDVQRKEYAFFYTDLISDCNYASDMIENVFSIYLLDTNQVVPEIRCVIQIKIDRISSESVKQFVEQLRSKS